MIGVDELWLEVLKCWFGMWESNWFWAGGWFPNSLFLIYWTTLFTWIWGENLKLELPYCCIIGITAAKKGFTLWMGGLTTWFMDGKFWGIEEAIF